MEATELTTKLESYVDAVKKACKTTEEIGRLLQQLERDKFEYEEAKKIVTHYERLNSCNDIMIEACEKILKEKNHDRQTRRS